VTGGLLGRAGREIIGAPRLWAIALAGFLGSGGIVLFALPIVVLPSVVGMSTFIGPNAVTAAGPSTHFVQLVTTSLAVLSVWILLGTLVSVAAERALVRAVVVPSIVRSGGPELLRLLAIRLVGLVPFGLALALGGARLGQVGYQELILPSESTAPFVVRVLLATPEVIAILVLGWLISELIATVGVRLAILEGRGTLGSVAGSVGWIVRRPGRALGLLGATALAGILVVAPALALSVAAWSSARTALLGSAAPVASALAVVVFVAVWGGALMLAGVVAAWRSAAWSLAMVGDHRVGGPTPGSSGTL
jgi:hypothetical protein